MNTLTFIIVSIIILGLIGLAQVIRSRRKQSDYTEVQIDEAPRFRIVPHVTFNSLLIEKLVWGEWVFCGETGAIYREAPWLYSDQKSAEKAVKKFIDAELAKEEQRKRNKIFREKFLAENPTREVPPFKYI